MENYQQLAQKLKQENELLRDEIVTKQKHLKTQKQSSQLNQTHMQILRAKVQQQKQKIISLQLALKEANQEKEKLKDRLVEAEQKFYELQQKSRKLQNEISASGAGSKSNSSIYGSRIDTPQMLEKKFPSFIGQLTYQAISKQNQQSVLQKNLQNEILSKDIKIISLEQKVKGLQTTLQINTKEKDSLKQKIAKLENEKKECDKQAKQLVEKIRKLESEKEENLQINFASSLKSENNYLSREAVIENRRQYFDEQFKRESILIAPNKTHLSIFKAIMSHIDSVEENKRTSFLKMLNVWTEQKIQRIYNSIQGLSQD